MLFKKDNHPLSFGNCVLEDKECHKHLGLIFQSNCKWQKHIIGIIRNVTLPISCLRSFKYKLCRKALDITYKSFILPQFDYADIVWDNCSGTLSNMLKNLRLEAIRIILGAVRGTSHERLYKESGFCSLKERRKRHKLFMFHKMINHQCPGYLSNLVPPLVSTTSPYHRRRPHERVIPAHKTELYANSFIPSTTQLWNTLPQTIQTNPSISLLKKYLSTNHTMVPIYYYFGSRKEQVKYCRLRLAISDLNNDLFRRHLLEDPIRSCRYTAETSEHFLLHCPLYNSI